MLMVSSEIPSGVNPALPVDVGFSLTGAQEASCRSAIITSDKHGINACIPMSNSIFLTFIDGGGVV